MYSGKEMFFPVNLSIIVRRSEYCVFQHLVKWIWNILAPKIQFFQPPIWPISSPEPAFPLTSGHSFKRLQNIIDHQYKNFFCVMVRYLDQGDLIVGLNFSRSCQAAKPFTKNYEKERNVVWPMSSSCLPLVPPNLAMAEPDKMSVRFLFGWCSALREFFQPESQAGFRLCPVQKFCRVSSWSII